MGHGKTEAYFFPPLNVPPYNLDLHSVKTRLGLKPSTSKEQVSPACSLLYHATHSCYLHKVLECLKCFGTSDDLYTLLEEYPIRPWESWTIEEKIIHAPGIPL